MIFQRVADIAIDTLVCHSVKQRQNARRQISTADVVRWNRIGAGHAGRFVLNHRARREDARNFRAVVVEVDIVADRHRLGNGVAVVIRHRELRRDRRAQIHGVIRIRGVVVVDRQILRDAHLPELIDRNRKGGDIGGVTIDVTIVVAVDAADDDSAFAEQIDVMTIRRRQAGIHATVCRRLAVDLQRDLIGRRFIRTRNERTHHNWRQIERELRRVAHVRIVADLRYAVELMYDRARRRVIALLPGRLVDRHCRAGLVERSDLRNVVGDLDRQLAVQRHAVAIAVRRNDQGAEVQAAHHAVRTLQIGVLAAARNMIELIKQLELEIARGVIKRQREDRTIDQRLITAQRVIDVGNHRVAHDRVTQRAAVRGQAKGLEGRDRIRGEAETALAVSAEIHNAENRTRHRCRAGDIELSGGGAVRVTIVGGRAHRQQRDNVAFISVIRHATAADHRRTVIVEMDIAANRH